MCGIAGFFSLKGEPASAVVLKRMTDSIRHRGPDGEGQYVDRGLGLGHRRLAIIDLSPAGHQPMMSADGRHVLSYNGEIYNYLELRVELEALGHRFRSQTDTEVLLAAWREWGAASLTRFNGMFAFAIWDRETESLTLARDRYGIKPIYVAQRNGVIAFASEIKAILQHPDFGVELDKEGLLEYFTFQNFFTPRTLFKGVQLLPPGHWMRVDRERGWDGKWTQYWDFNFHEPETSMAAGDYLEELDRLFKQAVRRQLVADVEVGSYLSGGMDSGSITAIAAAEFRNLKTFTCGFDLHSASGIELAFDERERAEFMSYKFGTEHYEMVLKAGDMERVMPRLVRHLEEPRVGQSYPNYYVAQLASKFVKVCLAGTGGDEMFAGYPWRYYRAVSNDNFEAYVDKYYAFWQRLIPNSILSEVFRPIWTDVKHIWTRDIFRDVFRHHAPKFTRPEDYVNHSLYFEAKTFLHGLLVVEDKLSMAHSLETRVPFLDNDLVDFAMRVPVGLKLGNLREAVRINENEAGKAQKHFEKTKDGKLILRAMMERYIPKSITDGIKQGFSAPDASWFKGESMDYVRKRLWPESARIFRYLDASSTQRLVQDHLNGVENRRLLIWSLLNLDEWIDQFRPRD